MQPTTLIPLKPSSRKNLPVVGPVIGKIVLLILIVSAIPSFVTSLLSTSQSASQNEIIVYQIGIAVVVLASLGLVIYLPFSFRTEVRNHRLNQNLRVRQAWISQHPLFIGNTFTFSCQIPAIQPFTLKACTCQLLFSEKATYETTETYTETVGSRTQTRTRTVTRTLTHDYEIHSVSHPGGNYAPNTSFDWQTTFTVPMGSMHTFHTKNHDLSWSLRWTIQLAGTSAIRESYLIHVRGG